MVEGRQDQTAEILNFLSMYRAFVDRIENSDDLLKVIQRVGEQRPSKPYLFSPIEIGQSGGLFG